MLFASRVMGDELPVMFCGLEPPGAYIPLPCMLHEMESAPVMVIFCVWGLPERESTIGVFTGFGVSVIPDAGGMLSMSTRVIVMRFGVHWAYSVMSLSTGLVNKFHAAPEKFDASYQPSKR